MTADPENLGPYRIVRRAGVGGMGVVYEAVHTGLDKRVALKVLPRELAAGRLERFLREARTAAALHHTNIVPVFDVGQVDGVPYYAMQFIDGRPLAAPSNPRRETHAPIPDPATRTHDPAPETGTKTLPPDGTTADHDPATGRREPLAGSLGGLMPPARPDVRRVVPLILQAAEGLAYAHARGVVHRDIKPSNLILDADGVLWVADFGLAFRTDDPTLTTEGSILGTPRYMSPEQARAEKTDCRTDVYSLGVTLYELLTGTVAFAGDTPMGVVRKVLTHTPPRPRALNRDIPRDLETVVLKAMAKTPADRYASGRELADDLKRFLAGEPVKARRITPIGKAWRWAKRNPAVASLLAAVLVVSAAGASVSMYFASQARERERQANASADDARRKEAEATAAEGRAVASADEARRKETEATAAKNAVLAAEAANRRLLYAARINLASVALRERRYNRVGQLLRDTFPNPGDEDYRGWEWHYLFRQIHSESALRDWPTVSTWPLVLTTRLVTSDRVVWVDHRDGKEVRSWTFDIATQALVGESAGSATFSRKRRIETPSARRLLFEDGHAVVVWNAETGTVGAVLPTGGRRTPPGGGRIDFGDLLPGSAFYPMNLSANGERYACVIRAPDDPSQLPPIGGGPELAAIEVWGVNPVRKLFTLRATAELTVGEINELRFSPDGRWLAVWSRQGRCLAWDLNRGKLRLDTRTAGAARIADMENSSLVLGGRRLAVRSPDATLVEVHDLSAPNASPVRLTGFQAADTMAFDSAGRRLAVGDTNGEIRVFDLDGRDPPHLIRTAAEGFSVRAGFEHLAFSRDGRRLLGFPHHLIDKIREWDLTRLPARRADASPKSVYFDPSGRRLLARVEHPDDPWHSQLELWDADTLARRRVLTRREASVYWCSPGWSPDGKQVALCEAVPLAALGFLPPAVPGPAGLGVLAAVEPYLWQLVILDPETGTRTATVPLGEHAPSSAEFSPCGRFVLLESEGTAVLVEAATGRRVLTHRVQVPRNDDVRFASFFVGQPPQLAVVRQDHLTYALVVEVWSESPTGWVKKEVDRDTGFDWRYAARSADGRWLAIDGILRYQDRTRQVRVYDATTGTHRLVTLHANTGGETDTNRLSFDGPWLWAFHFGLAGMFKVGTWEPGPLLPGDGGTVGSVDVTPDGKRAIIRYTTDSRHPRVKVWDTATGQELLTVPQEVDSPTDVGFLYGDRSHFDGHRYTFSRLSPDDEFELQTLDGTPVPDAVARERLGIK